MKSLLVFSSLFTSAYAFSGYLDNLASSSPLSGAGITEYTDHIPSTSTPTHGAGITSYLDTIGGSATVPEVPVIPAPLPTAVTEAPIDRYGNQTVFCMICFDILQPKIICLQPIYVTFFLSLLVNIQTFIYE